MRRIQFTELWSVHRDIVRSYCNLVVRRCIYLGTGYVYSVHSRRRRVAGWSIYSARPKVIAIPDKRATLSSIKDDTPCFTFFSASSRTGNVRMLSRIFPARSEQVSVKLASKLRSTRVYETGAHFIPLSNRIFRYSVHWGFLDISRTFYSIVTSKTSFLRRFKVRTFFIFICSLFFSRLYYYSMCSKFISSFPLLSSRTRLFLLADGDSSFIFASLVCQIHLSV